MNQKKRHQEISRFYNTKYYANRGTAKNNSLQYKELLNNIAIHKGQTLLDIACGSGEWLNKISNNDNATYGIDISEVAVNICKYNNPESQVVVATGENIPFKNNYFDIITCLGSLEHFIDQEKALLEMVRVARKNALILILVPNSEFPTYKLGLFKGTEQIEAKETFRTINEWQTMFNAAGIEVMDIRKDLHVLNSAWVMRKGILQAPARLLQAVLLLIWPLKWQYQLFFYCRIK